MTPRMSHPDYLAPLPLRIVGWAILLFLWWLALSMTGVLADEAGTEHADWYNGLTQPNGVSCCSVADCGPVDYRAAGDGIEAEIGGQWLKVPPEVILQNKPNPTGRGVACVIKDALQGWRFLCFVRAADI